MNTRECNCSVKNGKTQCGKFGGEVNNQGEITICQKARRQQQSAEAVRTRALAVLHEPPKPDKEQEVREILAGLIEMISRMNLVESDRYLLKCYRDRMNEVLYG